jgi:hypothetical protein
MAGRTTFEVYLKAIGSTWGGWDLYVRDVTAPATCSGFYGGRQDLAHWERCLYAEGHDLGGRPSVPRLAFESLFRDGKAEHSS